MGEAMIEILKLVASAIIGGGIAGGILNWFLQRRDRQEERRIQTIRDQLQNLYAPVYFFTSQNEECFRLCNDLSTALDSDKLHTVNKDGHRRSHLTKEEVEDTINLSNDYVAIVKRDNEQIADLLRHNWAYVEQQDVEVFRQMMVDHIRLKTEFPDGKKMKIPFLVYREIGNVSFMRREFAERVRQRVEEKQRILEPEKRRQAAKCWRPFARTARNPQH
jgi:urease gamma subunit